MEKIKSFKDFDLYQSKDPEGRRIYACSEKGRNPVQFIHYSQKSAIQAYKENRELEKDF